MKDCNQCGKCCIKYGGADLAASKADIDRWEDRYPEIFKYVQDQQIWFDPESGERLTQCPFLEEVPRGSDAYPVRYTCAIYQNRPEDCRLYPSLITEMVRDECEMIEAGDLSNPTKAQAALDVLMIDNR